MRYPYAKRIAGLLLPAALLLSLAACGGGNASSVGAQPSGSDSPASSGAASEASSEAASPAASQATSEAVSAGSGSGAGGAASAPQAGAAAASTPQGGPEPGRFVHLDAERYPDDRAPYLELLDDGRFVFRLNSGMGLGEARGGYSQSGSRLTLNIEELEIDANDGPVRGQEFTSLTLVVLGNDYLRYDGEAFGLTLRGNVFTREGAPAYDPAVTPPAASSRPVTASSEPPASAPQSVQTSSRPAASEPTEPDSEPPASSGQPASEPDSAASQPAGGVGITTVAPGQDPPAKMKVGDAFKLTGIDTSSLVYTPAYFEVSAGIDGQSATLIALQPGETILAYALTGDEERMEYTIAIAESGTGAGGTILVAVLSVLAGSGITVGVLLYLRHRKATAEARNAKKAEKKALADEKRTAKEAAVKEKRAADAAKQASQAAEEASKAAEQAALAAEQARSLQVGAQNAGAAGEEKKAPAADEKKPEAPTEKSGPDGGEADGGE